MASSSQKRRDNPTSSGNFQEPLGSMDRPVPLTESGIPLTEEDINLRRDVEGDLVRDETLVRNRPTGNVSADSAGRGFTTTFAVAAVVLLFAFLVALYLGSRGTEQLTAPVSEQAPVSETAPATGTTGTTTDTTGNTGIGNPVPAPSTPESTVSTTGSGTTGTTGTTGSTNP